MSRHRTTTAFLFALLLGWAFPATAEARAPRIVFPVVAKAAYTDDFGAPRGTGSHEGNDLMARKKSKVVAVEAGRVTKWTKSANAGCMLYLHGKSGTVYLYVHLNNDRTMRNDTHDTSTCKNRIAYAPGLKSGQKVQAGELLGYVGDSGDADGIASHLHFERHPSGGEAVSPYKALRSARKLLFARPPASVTRQAGRIEGRVVWTELEEVRIKVKRVRISRGWWVRPARGVTVAVPPSATVSRLAQDGATRPAALASASPGERIVLWTTSFPQTLPYARAAAGLHTAKAIELQG